MLVMQRPFERQYESELQQADTVPFAVQGISVETDLSGR